MKRTAVVTLFLAVVAGMFWLNREQSTPEESAATAQTSIQVSALPSTTEEASEPKVASATNTNEVIMATGEVTVEIEN